MPALAEPTAPPVRVAPDPQSQTVVHQPPHPRSHVHESSALDALLMLRAHLPPAAQRSIDSAQCIHLDLIPSRPAAHAESAASSPLAPAAKRGRSPAQSPRLHLIRAQSPAKVAPARTAILAHPAWAATSRSSVPRGYAGYRP